MVSDERMCLIDLLPCSQMPAILVSLFYQNADMPEIKIWQLQDSTDLRVPPPPSLSLD